MLNNYQTQSFYQKFDVKEYWEWISPSISISPVFSMNCDFCKALRMMCAFTSLPAASKALTISLIVAGLLSLSQPTIQSAWMRF